MSFKNAWNPPDPQLRNLSSTTPKPNVSIHCQSKLTLNLEYLNPDSQIYWKQNPHNQKDRKQSEATRPRTPEPYKNSFETPNSPIINTGRSKRKQNNRNLTGHNSSQPLNNNYSEPSFKVYYPRLELQKWKKQRKSNIIEYKIPQKNQISSCTSYIYKLIKQNKPTSQLPRIERLVRLILCITTTTKI